MSGRRELTVFGTALADLFFALVVFNLTLLVVFAISYIYARGVDLSACRPVRGEIDEVACLTAIRMSSMPGWLTLVNRGAIAASGTLVIGTAIGTAWEMSRARTSKSMVVHVEAWDDGPTYEGPERRSGNDRRDGWGKLSRP